MNRPSAANTPRDPLWALFLCLLVLAQLLLPTAFERARAAQDDGCVAGGGVTADAGSASKKMPHAHGQECAHCRPQAVVLAAPVLHPQVAVAAAFEATIAHGDAISVAPQLQPLPPPTGPPAIGDRV